MEAPLKILVFLLIGLIVLVVIAFLIINTGSETGTAIDQFFDSMKNWFKGFSGFGN